MMTNKTKAEAVCTDEEGDTRETGEGGRIKRFVGESMVEQESQKWGTRGMSGFGA